MQPFVYSIHSFPSWESNFIYLLGAFPKQMFISTHSFLWNHWPCKPLSCSYWLNQLTSYYGPIASSNNCVFDVHVHLLIEVLWLSGCDNRLIPSCLIPEAFHSHWLLLRLHLSLPGVTHFLLFGEKSADNLTLLSERPESALPQLGGRIINHVKLQQSMWGEEYKTLERRLSQVWAWNPAGESSLRRGRKERERRWGWRWLRGAPLPSERQRELQDRRALENVPATSASSLFRSFCEHVSFSQCLLSQVLNFLRRWAVPPPRSNASPRLSLSVSSLWLTLFLPNINQRSLIVWRGACRVFPAHMEVIRAGQEERRPRRQEKVPVESLPAGTVDVWKDGGFQSEAGGGSLNGFRLLFKTWRDASERLLG